MINDASHGVSKLDARLKASEVANKAETCLLDCGKMGVHTPRSKAGFPGRITLNGLDRCINITEIELQTNRISCKSISLLVNC